MLTPSQYKSKKVSDRRPGTEKGKENMWMGILSSYNEN